MSNFTVTTVYHPFLRLEYETTSPEDIERLYIEAVDRWTWDTGSSEDAELIRKLGRERSYRRMRSRKELPSSSWCIETQ